MVAALKIQPLALVNRYLVAALQALIVAVLFQGGSAKAETINIATGEYPPFLSEQLPEHGVIGAIVTAAIKAQGGEVSYTYLPWKRGYIEAEQGTYVATFPYLKIAEREAAFHYSAPIYTDHFRMFINRGNETDRRWMNKAICIPLGYDTSQIKDFVTKHNIFIEQPASITNCFNMLHAKRVDGVWASQLVGVDTATTLFGSAHVIAPIDVGFTGDSKYYFIISRKLPDAEKWLARFNTGLKKIQTNGTYQQILARFPDN